MHSTDELIFESRDIEIFTIPDTKTKLNTLQNYFFPRLQRLIDMALGLVGEIYKIDPFEKYSFVYRPSHRKDAKFNADYNEVYIGIASRRNPNSSLKISKPDGVLPTGDIYVEFLPFRYSVDSVYIKTVALLL